MFYRLSLLLLIIVTTAHSAVDWKSLTAATLATVPYAEFKTITDVQIASIPAAACSGFQTQQLQQITTSFGTAGNCGGFIAKCISNILPDAFAGIQGPCLIGLKTNVVSAITADQLTKISIKTFSSIDTIHLSQITTACRGLQQNQINALPTSTDV
jgi:hypothetical protein